MDTIPEVAIPEAVIPQSHNAGQFLQIHLDPNPSHRSQWWRQIPGFGRINGLSFVPDGKGWLVKSPMLPLLSSLGDLFRPEGFFYVDAQLHPHLISKTSTNISGVLSPDGKRMAFLGANITSNVWLLNHVSTR